MATNVYYTSDIDLQNARQALGNEYNYVQYTPGSSIGTGSLAVGGSAVIPDSAISGGVRLGGADRNATNAALQGYASTKSSQSTNQQITPTNNVPYIQQQNQAALQGIISSIKAAVQKAKVSQQGIITKAPEQYGNLKNIVYNQSLATLPGMRENTANLGMSTNGSYSRTQETKVNSDLQNRLGELDRLKQSVIDEANQNIAELEAEGDIQAANATYESAQSTLQQILAETARLDTLNNTNYWNSANYALSEKSTNASVAGQELQNQITALTLQYQPQILSGQIDAQKLSNEYQSLINQGYPAQQAAALAATKASTAATYAGISQGNVQVEASSYSDLVSQLNKLYTAQDSVTGKVTINNSEALKNAILALAKSGNISTETGKKLYAYYGLE